ncbi:hypothetical protein HMI56_005568 [Coelomomyces lativittatus]|nr:hypothetical protein HMI56_005568 [Coelomomyces lativittatus]
MNKPLNSPTTRSRSPTLSSSPPYFPSDPNSNSISTFQKQPPLYTFENSDAYLNDTSSAHPTLPLPQPQVVTIPSPFSSTVTSPHQDLHVPFDMSSPSGLTRVNLSRPLLNGHGRPYPTSFFLVASILLLCFSTSNGTTSVFLQSLLCMVTPFLFIFLKQLWVPNPKDDDVLVPSSIPSYIRKFGFISCLWYGICLFSFTTINAVPGPIALSCTQVCEVFRWTQLYSVT